ncbi:MAG TPA: histidine kinase [Glycomyces sp.]|nr:histidine kinase [Glycomyces sp.]
MIANAPPPRRLARVAPLAAAALGGAAFGAATLWDSGLGPLTLTLVAVLAGVAVAFLERPLSTAVVAVAAALPASVLAGRGSGTEAVLGLVVGMSYAGGCFLVALLVTSMLRTRRDYVRRGWELAFAEAREHEARVGQAVASEREAMAGEIHDGLGHRLTLIAVQAARLSLDEELPERARAELQRIRENAAVAADELGETVRLLSERTSGATASLSGVGVAEVIERARSSGVTVRDDVAPEVEDAVNDYTHAALLRALQEGLTNAAKHAPGEEARVRLGLEGEEAVLVVRNRAPQQRERPASTGHGMVALRHRVAILGGTLAVEREEDFAVTVRLPRRSTPSGEAADLEPSRLGVLTAEAARAERRNRRATRRAWLVPAAMILAIALVSAGYFVHGTVASVLPPERFAAIEVGDTRAEAERVLPPMEMFDAPRLLLPEPEGASCRYYEPSVSFFERGDVYRVCFADDRVVATDTIPPS